MKPLVFILFVTFLFTNCFGQKSDSSFTTINPDGRKKTTFLYKGKVRSEISYNKEGEIEKQELFHKNGKTESTHIMKKGVMLELDSYYKNGQKKREDRNTETGVWIYSKVYKSNGKLKRVYNAKVPKESKKKTK